MKRVAEMLRRETGLDAAALGPNVISRTLRGRMTALGLTDETNYCAHALANPAEWAELVEAAVVSETWFFRDPAAFCTFLDLYRQTAVRSQESAGGVPRSAFCVPSSELRPPPRILSAPCATGEEPYTIAMTLLDAGVPAENIALDALDLSHRALARARAGIYTRNAFRGGDTRQAGAPGTQGTQGQPTSPTPSVLDSPRGIATLFPRPGAQSPAGENGQSGQNGQNGQSAPDLGVRGLGAARALAALSPSMSTMAAVYGESRLEQMRREVNERRAEARGSFASSWSANRASIENYIPEVAVGNQTALRTAASPFASYITSMHRGIHEHFADGFLAGLEHLPDSSPLQDRSLATEVEIVLEGNGAIHRLGIVRSSGSLPFDVAALNAVRRAAPYGQAPGAVLSYDGKVYVHWGFHRDHQQCGTFNARPFILSGPSSPRPSLPGRRRTRPTPSEEPPAAPPSPPGSSPTPGPRTQLG